MTQRQYRLIIHFAKREMSKNLEPQHDWGHAERVGVNAKRIVSILGLEKKINTELLLICCYLHDLPISRKKPSAIGSVVHHFLERQLINRYMPGVLRSLPMDSEEQKTVLTAIRNHPLSFPYGHLNRNKDIYSKILQDADTLDNFSEDRVRLFEFNEKKYRFFAVIGAFKKSFLTFGVKNLHKYLNFPEIVDSLSYTDGQFVKIQ